MPLQLQEEENSQCEFFIVCEYDNFATKAQLVGIQAANSQKIITRKKVSNSFSNLRLLNSTICTNESNRLPTTSQQCLLWPQQRSQKGILESQKYLVQKELSSTVISSQSAISFIWQNSPISICIERPKHYFASQTPFSPSHGQKLLLRGRIFLYAQNLITINYDTLYF